MGWALLAGLLPIPNTPNEAVWRFWAEAIPFAAIVSATLLFWLLEKKRIRLHILCAPLKSSAIGVAAGLFWIGAAALPLVAAGAMQIGERGAVPMLWLWSVSLFLNTLMQELLVRGYLYQMLKSRCNGIVAVTGTTALFVFLHGGALEAGVFPVLNVLTMSLLMTVVLEYTRSLLAPILMHFVWNWVGGIVLGGISLAKDYPCLYRTVFTGHALLSGGSFRLEGSVVVFAINLLLMLGFAMLWKRDSRR